MSRYLPLPPSSLPPEVRSLGEHIASNLEQRFGPNDSLITYKDFHDGLLGPFPIIIASREIGQKLLEVFPAFTELGEFPADAKETAILTAGARFQCDYERYAHKRLGIVQAGLTQEQVDRLAMGEKPEGLSEEADVNFDVVSYLANTPGPLPKELFEAAEERFGKDGTLLLIHYVGIVSALSCVFGMFMGSELTNRSIAICVC